jgi:hypothetical protein
MSDMPKTPYLVKRGHVFWWRRRKPVFMSRQPSHDIHKTRMRADGGMSGAAGHFAFSLRTTCPKEAGRRSARMNLVFEEKRRRVEAVMSRDDGMTDQSYLERAMADMAATLRAQAEMMARQMASEAPATGIAPPQQQVTGPAPSAKAPQAPTDAPRALASSRIDDPEFEQAILEMADREGWWHEDPDAIVAQFDMMLTGLFTLQEEYLRYCLRKGLDPAAALPSLAPLGGALSSATSDIRAHSTSAETAGAPDGPELGNARPRRPRRGSGGRRFSEHARRFLDLRSEGFDLKRRNETPDIKAGQRFTKTSRGNFEGTIRLFLEAHGDMFVENIDEALLAEFFSLLDRIPAQHGKSSKHRRPVRKVIEEADRDEQNAIERCRADMQRAGSSPGEIEESLNALRVRRLRTNTCKRHMDTMDQIIAFAQFEELRPDNPAKQVKWTPREIARRLANEEDADRLPWGDRLPGLLGSPIYRSPLSEPGDPLLLGSAARSLCGVSHGGSPATPDG